MLRILFLVLCFAFQADCLTVSELSYEGKLVPGENKQVKITLTNERNQPDLIELKLNDYTCNFEGQHLFEECNTHSRSNGSWITLSTNRVSLAPGEKTDIFFTVDVPKNDALKGSYWSVLLIEPADLLQATSTTKDGFLLNIKIRFAYHIVVDVGSGIAKLKILKKEVTTINDKKLLLVDVGNVGEKFLNPKITLKLYGASGKLEKTLETQTERLYPGNSQRYFLDVAGITPGKFKGFLLLDNGDSHLFGDTFELIIP